MCSKNDQMNLWAVGTEGGTPKGLGRRIELLVLHRIIELEKDLGNLVRLVTAEFTLSHGVKCCVFLVFEHLEVRS